MTSPDSINGEWIQMSLSGVDSGNELKSGWEFRLLYLPFCLIYKHSQHNNQHLVCSSFRVLMKLEHSGVALVQAHTQDSTSNLVVIMPHTHTHMYIGASYKLDKLWTVFTTLNVSTGNCRCLSKRPNWTWLHGHWTSWRHGLWKVSLTSFWILLPPDRKRVF